MQHQRRGRADRKAATSPTPPTPPRNGNAIGTSSPITSPSPLNPSATAAATADAAAAAAETTPQPKPKPSQSPASAANNTAHHLDLPSPTKPPTAPTNAPTQHLPEDERQLAEPPQSPPSPPRQSAVDMNALLSMNSLSNSNNVLTSSARASSSSSAANPTSPSSTTATKAMNIRSPDRGAAPAQPWLWVTDHAAPCCMQCGKRFGLMARREHCQLCGVAVCVDCTINGLPGRPSVKACRRCRDFNVGKHTLMLVVRPAPVEVFRGWLVKQGKFSEK